MTNVYVCCLLLLIWSPLVLSGSMSSCDPYSSDPIRSRGYMDFALLHSFLLFWRNSWKLYSQQDHLFCQQGDQYTCFDPQYSPTEKWLKVWHSYKSGKLINLTQITNPKLPVSILFDACEAMNGPLTSTRPCESPS